MSTTPQPGDREVVPQFAPDVRREVKRRVMWRLGDPRLRPMDPIDQAANELVEAVEAALVAMDDMSFFPSPVSTPDTRQAAPHGIPVLVCDACGGYALEDELPFPHRRSARKLADAGLLREPRKRPRRAQRSAPHGDDCRCVECAVGAFSARPATAAEIADWGYDDD